jgi:hypothetical protein
MEQTYAEPEEADYSDSSSESDGERYNCSVIRDGLFDKIFPRQGSFWTQDEGAKNAMCT